MESSSADTDTSSLNAAENDYTDLDMVMIKN